LNDINIPIYSRISVQIDFSPFSKRVKQVLYLPKKSYILKSSFLKIDISERVFSHVAI